MGESTVRRRVVLARNLHAANLAGFSVPSRGTSLVTPGNLDLVLRGQTIDESVRVIAVNLTDAEVNSILWHPSIAPGWVPYGKPNVEHVPTH